MSTPAQAAVAISARPMPTWIIRMPKGTTAAWLRLLRVDIAARPVSDKSALSAQSRMQVEPCSPKQSFCLDSKPFEACWTFQPDPIPKRS